MLRRSAILGAVLVLFCCANALASNVLVVVLDDVGADVMDNYQPYFNQPVPSNPVTPTIDGLASTGVTFLNAWANPWCATTRASLNFGRYGLRTRTLGPMPGKCPLGGELTVPEILQSAQPGVRTAMIGKWGIAQDDWLTTGPVAQGFQYARTVSFGAEYINNYCEWTKVDDASSSGYTSTTYATTDNVHDAMTWIAAQGRSHPWYLYLAFNAAHDPLHVPPTYGNCPGVPLHPGYLSNGTTACDPVTHTVPACPTGSTRDCYRAMLQAADTELGCLLSTMDSLVRSQTTIIVVGDNGTPSNIVDPPIGGPGQSKGTVARGGVQVPLIVSGEKVAYDPDFPERTSDTLVNATDIFATTAEILTGQPIGNFAPASKYFDAVSFLPTLQGQCSAERNWIYADTGDFGPPSQTIRGPRYKYIRKGGAQASATCTVLYDLETDPFELCPVVRAGTGCGSDYPARGECDSPLVCDGFGQNPPPGSPCYEYYRLRDQMAAILTTGTPVPLGPDFTCYEPSYACVTCPTSTNYCSDSGVSCSFNGTCDRSGFCNSTCVSDGNCTGPSNPLPVRVGLDNTCLGGN